MFKMDIKGGCNMQAMTGQSDRLYFLSNKAYFTGREYQEFIKLLNRAIAGLCYNRNVRGANETDH